MGMAISADNPLYHWTWGKEEVSVKVVTLIDCIDEIAWAAGIGYILAIAWLKAVKHKILVRHLHWLKATDKTSEYDVWSDFFRSGNPYKEYTEEVLSKLRYAHVWSTNRYLLYCGWVVRFSEYDNFRELTLFDVEIYQFDKNLKIYGPPIKQSFVYLSFANDDVWIEFPKLK